MNVKLAAKAVTYTVALMVAVAICMLLMFWTKGLFAILFVFGFVTWFMYVTLERRERMKKRRLS